MTLFIAPTGDIAQTGSKSAYITSRISPGLLTFAIFTAVFLFLQSFFTAPLCAAAQNSAAGAGSKVAAPEDDDVRYEILNKKPGPPKKNESKKNAEKPPLAAAPDSAAAVKKDGNDSPAAKESDEEAEPSDSETNNSSSNDGAEVEDDDRPAVVTPSGKPTEEERRAGTSPKTNVSTDDKAQTPINETAAKKETVANEMEKVAPKTQEVVTVRAPETGTAAQPHQSPPSKGAAEKKTTYKMAKKKYVVLSYSMSKPSKINRLTITVPKNQPILERAKKIEVMTSEFNSDDDIDWLSSGIFNLSDTSDVIVCNFEATLAQYIRIKILEGYGEKIYANIGKVSIGIASYRIVGTAVDSGSKKPLESTEVCIGGNRFFETDAAGKFSFDDCDYGTLEISARRAGYFDASQTIPVFSGKKVAITFKMKRHDFTLSGRAIDVDTKKPIALCEISISRQAKDGGRVTKKVISDELGFYKAQKLETGKYEIKASFEDYDDLAQTVQIESTKTYTVNFLMKSKYDNSPLGVTSFTPRAGEAATGEVRLVFSRPVSRKSLKTDNFGFEYHEDDIGSALSRKKPVEISDIRLDPADASGRTVLIGITFDPSLLNMPALDLNIMNVSDRNGLQMKESGILVSNFQ